MAVANGTVVYLAPYCSPTKPFFIRCLMKVVLPTLHWPTRRILGRSQNPPAPASGTHGSRAAPPGTAALWVQWPQALGHHLEELRLLFVTSILADPAEHAAGDASGWKLGEGIKPSRANGLPLHQAGVASTVHTYRGAGRDSSGVDNLLGLGSF